MASLRPSCRRQRRMAAAWWPEHEPYRSARLSPRFNTAFTAQQIGCRPCARTVGGIWTKRRRIALGRQPLLWAACLPMAWWACGWYRTPHRKPSRLRPRPWRCFSSRPQIRPKRCPRFRARRNGPCRRRSDHRHPARRRSRRMSHQSRVIRKHRHPLKSTAHACSTLAAWPHEAPPGRCSCHREIPCNTRRPCWRDGPSPSPRARSSCTIQ